MLREEAARLRPQVTSRTVHGDALSCTTQRGTHAEREKERDREMQAVNPLSYYCMSRSAKNMLKVTKGIPLISFLD